MTRSAVKRRSATGEELRALPQYRLVEHLAQVIGDGNTDPPDCPPRIGNNEKTSNDTPNDTCCHLAQSQVGLRAAHQVADQVNAERDEVIGEDFEHPRDKESSKAQVNPALILPQDRQ